MCPLIAFSLYMCICVDKNSCVAAYGRNVVAFGRGWVAAVGSACDSVWRVNDGEVYKISCDLVGTPTAAKYMRSPAAQRTGPRTWSPSAAIYRCALTRLSAALLVPKGRIFRCFFPTYLESSWLVNTKSDRDRNDRSFDDDDRIEPRRGCSIRTVSNCMAL